MSNDKNYTRGYVKGWTDRHKHGSELPSDLSNAINELQRLLTREEAGLPVAKTRKPLYVSGAKHANQPHKNNALAHYVWDAVKAKLAGHSPMMPKDIVASLMASGDHKVRSYIQGGRQRVGVMLVYYSKCDEPQVKRVKDGYELIPNGGTQ